MSHPAFNYLRAHRQRCGLSEEELARLLGRSRASGIGRFETGVRVPNGEFLLGCEVVFGVKPRDLFPGLYETVEEAVMGRAADLSKTLEGKVDQASDKKRRLLAEMVERAADNTAGI